MSSKAYGEKTTSTSASTGERREHGPRIDDLALPNARRRLHQRRPLRVRHFHAFSGLVANLHLHRGAIGKVFFQNDDPT